MNIFEAVVDEIALSGLEGCTTKELWHHLTNRKCPSTFPLALDEQAKCYIWSLLHDSSSGIINFYVLQSARQFQEDNLTFTYRLVSNAGIRGSCWDYDTREDITAAILNDDCNRNLCQVTTRYGEDRLVMVATQEVRVKALTIPSMDPMYSINDVQYCALEAIGKARDQGILRTHLTNNFLKIDPRSTFHHVAVLQSIGVITIKAYSKGFQLFHTRFSGYANLLDGEDTLTKKVCNLLLQAPDHSLPENEIAKELGNVKRYRRIRRVMLSRGYVEFVKSSDGEIVKPQLLRLVKPVKQATAVATDLMSGEGMDPEESHEAQEGNRTLQKHFVVAEQLFDIQAYKVLDSAGPTGMTTSEFHQSIEGVDYNTRKVVLNNLSKQGCIVSILIDDEKVKKYRYISSRQADKSSDISKLKSAAKKSSHAFTLAIRTKNASLIDQKTTDVSAPTSAGPTVCKTSASLEAPTTTMVAVESTTVGDADGNISDEDTEVESILKNASHDVGVTGGSNSATSTPTLDTDFHKRLDVKGIPLRKMERINFILDCIETDKVIMYKYLLHKRVVEFETQKGITTKMDRKTFSKLLQSLVDKGMLNVKTIELSSKVNHSIYYHNSVTDAQLAEAVAEVKENFTVKDEAKKRKEKEKAKKREEDDNDVVITMPDTVTNLLKDDAFVFIPVASKFQRLQHLHLYLWILQYGLPDDAKMSSVTFPWIPAVSKVDNIDDVIRWGTITGNMPLSLLIITVGVSLKQMPRKLYKFIQRPEYRNLTLRQLPKRIQLYINSKRRDVMRLYELLQMLEDMKLIVIHQPTGYLIKINVEVELLHSCSILDTSNIKIRHSFFLEECRSKFNSIPFQFDSVNDLQAYWFKLKSVCLMTKIFKPRGDELPDDEGALHLIGGSRRLSKDYNKLGFGAGGVVPLMYSHLLYNWGTMTFFKSEEDFQDLTTDDEPILPEITYTDLPIVPPDDLTDEAKRQPLYEMGGRSRQKRKLDGISTTVSAAKRVKKAASQKVHKKKTNLSSKEKRSRVRTTLLVWSKKEDAVVSDG